MIFVGKQRVDGDPAGNRTDSWVAVGDLHVFVGDDPSNLRALCGMEVELLPNEVPTLEVPPGQASRAIDQFLGDPIRCPKCARWIRENRSSLFTAEKIGEEVKP